jgi:26S proteasome regulatory subunit N1
MARTAEILVDTCSYAGTGNVLKVQQMLHVLSKRSATSSPEADDTAAAAEDEADADAEDIEVDESAANSTTTPVSPTAPRAPEAAATAAEAAPAADAAGDKDKDKEVKDGCNYQSVAVIGIALIAMGEEVGSEMALRHFQHLVSLESRVSACGVEARIQSHISSTFRPTPLPPHPQTDR